MHFYSKIHYIPIICGMILAPFYGQLICGILCNIQEVHISELSYTETSISVYKPYISTYIIRRHSLVALQLVHYEI
jgi:hypothetical protein